jgi:uncharacterized protein YqjF (DUF2071 family)
MLQTWSWLTFLHWSYQVEVVARLLPPGLAVHELEGRAWVGLTPFVLGDLRTPVAPAPPWFARFPETNLRTYVAGPGRLVGHGRGRGLPAPEGEPVAHWSPGVRTRISAWRPLVRAGR